MNKYFLHGFEKRALLEIDDLEDQVDYSFTDAKVLARAQQLADKANDSSFALRHPLITGIPTLGIWPTVAKGNAINKALGALQREHPGFFSKIRQEHEREDARIHKQNVELQELRKEETKAQRDRDVAEQATVAALTGLGMYLNKDKREEGY